MRHLAILMVAMIGLSACALDTSLDTPPPPLGDFSLGHNVVVAPKVATTASLSREVSKEDLTASLREAIADRFGRYEGPSDYHFGVSIEGYVLARRGVPVVAAPKSAMIIRLTVWDDAAGAKLNPEPEQITVIEDIDGESLFGTGWFQTADTQLQKLSVKAAKAIEDYLVERRAEDGWFQGGDPDAETDQVDGAETAAPTRPVSREEVVSTE